MDVFNAKGKCQKHPEALHYFGWSMDDIWSFIFYGVYITISRRGAQNKGEDDFTLFSGELDDIWSFWGGGIYYSIKINTLNTKWGDSKNCSILMFLKMQ